MCPQTPISRKCLVTVVALKRESRPRIAHLKKSLTKKKVTLRRNLGVASKHPLTGELLAAKNAVNGHNGFHSL